MKLNPKHRLKSYIDHRMLQLTQQQEQELAALRAYVEELHHRQTGQVEQRTDAWGEELAKLGHLGHERANLACEDAAYARSAMEGVLDRLATSSREAGLRLTRVDERIARTERALSELKAQREPE
jgi:hypothetical protein